MTESRFRIIIHLMTVTELLSIEIKIFDCENIILHFTNKDFQIDLEMK
jgi:hypothetical protein